MRGREGNTSWLRPAALADCPAIARLHAASIAGLCAGHYSPAQIKAWVGVIQPAIYESALREKVFLLAEDASGLLGLGMADLNTGEINAVYVLPSATGRGVGSLLMGALEEAAREKGLSKLTLHATLNAEGFYQRLGYQPQGKARHKLSDGTSLACIRMVKEW